jgi:hypothetical protein
MSLARKLDPELLPIALVILVSTGHVGTYLAGYEASGMEWVGFVQALAIDVGVVLAAHRLRWKTQRRAAIALYLFLAGVCGVLNWAYYRQANPNEQVLVLFAMAWWPPTTAAFLGTLKASTEARKEQAERRREARAEREAEREERRAEHTNAPGRYDRQAARLLAERPDMGVRELARTLGCSSSTASRLKRRWGKEG